MKPWPGEKPGFEGWADAFAGGGYVCREDEAADEEMILSGMRMTPEPITVEEMCRAARFLAANIGECVGKVSGALSEGRAWIILDGGQLGVGLFIRSHLRAGGFRWSAAALDDHWLGILLGAVELWRRDRTLRGVELDLVLSRCRLWDIVVDHRKGGWL